MITLVLLPGMDGSGALFGPFIAALGGAVPTQIISYPRDQPLDYEGLTDFVRARIPLDAPFVLLGESFSGPVAIALAASRPPGLAGLILSCTFARAPHRWLRPFRFLLPFLPLSPRLSFPLAPLLLGKHASRTMRRTLRGALENTTSAVLKMRLLAVLDIDYSNELVRIDVPVLYLQATRDWVVLRSSARHVASVLPTVRVITIAGPHLLLQASPDGAARAVMSFVETLQGPERITSLSEP